MLLVLLIKYEALLDEQLWIKIIFTAAAAVLLSLIDIPICVTAST
jgi:hypothetical protein